MQELQKAYEECSGSHLLLFLKLFPVYDGLHSDPRFIELVRKIGVEPG